MTSLAQTKTIHVLRRQIPHYSDADYRGFLLREFNVDSSTRLSTIQAARVIDTLKTLAGQNGKLRRASDTADGPYAGKLRALWISAYNLGIVRNRDDRAMIAFVQRQAKVSHTRFLTDPKDAAKAIEALKSWIAREGGFDWPLKDESEGMADTKRAVAKTVAKRAVETGAFKPFIDFETDWPSVFERYGYGAAQCPASFEFYGPEHWDQLAGALGRKLRAHLASQKRKAA
jgi:hypothetical protein